MHPFEAELVSRKFAEDDRDIRKEMALVHDPDIPVGETRVYIETSRTLMEAREAQILGKRTAFALDMGNGWRSPSEKDAAALHSTHAARPPLSDA